MKQPIFIRLENSLGAAMEYRNSPEMDIYSFRGVHLLPSSPYVYVQRTYAVGGINIENYEVSILDICGNVLFDGVEDSFDIIRTFQDPDTGTSQLEWSFNTAGLECNDQLVYLFIKQGGNGEIYSSPFYLTDNNREYTSRWDYKSNESDTMLSTQLEVWYKDNDDFEEIEVLDTVSGNGRVAIGGKLIPFEIWQFNIVRKDILSLFKQLRRNSIVYCNLVRAMPFSAFETPRLQGRENFVEAEIELTFNYNDRYDPDYIPSDPVPTPPDKYISLVSVRSINSSQVIYFFGLVNLNPDFLQFQYSLDQISWTTIAGDATSPKTVYVHGNDTNNYYYRIVDPVTNIISNTVQLPAPSISITNITGLNPPFKQSGNTYVLNFIYDGFQIQQNTNFALDLSVDNVNWYNNAIPNDKFTTSPIRFITPYSNNEFKYFRIRYYDITSNTYNFSF